MLFPTKALAQDQLRSITAAGVPGLVAATYDGDSSPEERTWVRRNANVLLTNPDMLHAGFLPGHDRWATFLHRLDYVVVDELHAMRGVFGSHVAHILRRLRRLCAHYGSDPTFIFTSATIPDTLSKNLGLPSDNTDKLTVSSPFNYPENSLLYVAKHLPDRKEELQYTPAMLEELVHLINAAGGRTLALFTNKKYMEATAAEVAKRIKTPVLVQGSRAKATLLEKFRDDESASLFAVASFWQGVDVPGKSLSLVTIDRLPFQPPTDPVGKARRERAGDHGFYEVDLPRATMMLAQGVGRLIRSAEDRGVVAVFDNRLATASYRHQILKRLPPMKRTIDRTEAEAFLETI